jgi:hypothetical protein
VLLFGLIDSSQKNSLQITKHKLYYPFSQIFQFSPINIIEFIENVGRSSQSGDDQNGQIV